MTYLSVSAIFSFATKYTTLTSLRAQTALRYDNVTFFLVMDFLNVKGLMRHLVYIFSLLLFSYS